MLLNIAHTTRYTYDAPVPYGMQQVRLTPKTRASQKIIDWQVDTEGGEVQLQFEDQHRNTVLLVVFEPDLQEIVIRCTGQVETTNSTGVMGEHRGYAPLWYFKRTTDLTQPGARVKALADGVDTKDGDAIAQLHGLSNEIAAQVSYQPGQTHVRTSAELVLQHGKGVCQDHVHVFLSAARLLGYPARYVSGYLMMNDRVDQDATHAWAEIHVNGLGWVGFDVSNAISPDERYVCAATGLDYLEAAPVSGMRLGDGHESLYVDVQVQQ